MLRFGAGPPFHAFLFVGRYWTTPKPSVAPQESVREKERPVQRVHVVWAVCVFLGTALHMVVVMCCFCFPFRVQCMDCVLVQIAIFPTSGTARKMEGDDGGARGF